MRAKTRRFRGRQPAQRTSFGSTLGVLMILGVLITAYLIISQNTNLL